MAILAKISAVPKKRMRCRHGAYRGINIVKSGLTGLRGHLRCEVDDAMGVQQRPGITVGDVDNLPRQLGLGNREYHTVQKWCREILRLCSATLNTHVINAHALPHPARFTGLRQCNGEYHVSLRRSPVMNGALPAVSVDD